VSVTVEVLTKVRMLAIEAASVVSGAINGYGHLILTKHDGSTVDAGSALPLMPAATESAQGAVELATNAEVIAGANSTAAVTPASLALGITEAKLAALAVTEGKIGSLAVTTGKIADDAVTTDKIADASLASGLIGIPGEIRMWGGLTAPTGWLLCDGSSLSRTTYSTLYDVIAPSLGSVTISIASPGVITSNAHGLVVGEQVFLTTTGALPTGLSANTRYYVVSSATNTITVSATLGGTAINTSGSQSGTHTLRRCPHGIADSTHFNAPNFKGKTAVGYSSAETDFNYVGKSGGEKTHTLTTAEIPSHAHTMTMIYGTGWSGVIPLGASSGTTYSGNTGNTGDGGSHNNIQPYLSVNYIIKY
jgi:microcystin-dependent protein